jgi:hypothetical protein
MKFATYADGRTIQYSRPIPTTQVAQIETHCCMNERRGARSKRYDVHLIVTKGSAMLELNVVTPIRNGACATFFWTRARVSSRVKSAAGR